MELSIECSKREDGSNPRALRREGLLPAVLYGHNGTESVSLIVNEREAEKLVRSGLCQQYVDYCQCPRYVLERQSAASRSAVPSLEG